MRYPEHPLITEAWRRVAQFEGEVERARVLKDRPSKPSRLHHRSALVLMWLAARLDPSLGRSEGPRHLEC